MIKKIIIIVIISQISLADNLISKWHSEVFIGEDSGVHVCEYLDVHGLSGKIGIKRLIPKFTEQSEILNITAERSGVKDLVEFYKKKSSLVIQVSNYNHFKFSGGKHDYKLCYLIKDFLATEDQLSIIRWEPVSSFWKTSKSNVKSIIVLPKHVSADSVKLRSWIYTNDGDIRKGEIEGKIYNSKPVTVEFTAKKVLNNEEGMRVEVLFPPLVKKK